MASDLFDRADDPDLGSEWIPITDLLPFAIVNNEARVDASGNLCAERYAADTPPDDQKSGVNLGEVEDTIDFGAGPAWRMSASEQTFYFAFANTAVGGEIQYGKDIAGSITLLGAYTAGAVPTMGQWLEGRGEGTRQSVWVDDVEVAFTTDAAIASGQCGVMGQVWNMFDALQNWSGGSLLPEEQEASLTWLVPIESAA